MGEDFRMEVLLARGVDIGSKKVSGQVKEEPAQELTEAQMQAMTKAHKAAQDRKLKERARV